MNYLALSLFTLLASSGAQSIAHDYEGGITAESISLQHNSTDILKQPFDYPLGTPKINPLNVTLGVHDETSWHKYYVPLWVYVTEGSFTVDYGSKGKKVMNKGMSYIEAMNCCHKGINGTQESKAIVVYMGVVSTANNLPCKPQ